MNKLLQFAFACFFCLAYVNESYSQEISICFWEDVNGDGLDNDSGTTITGGNIDLIAQGAGTDEEAVDNGSGCFTFDGLVNGETYCIGNLLPADLSMDAYTVDTGDSEAPMGTSAIDGTGGVCFTWTGADIVIDIGVYVFSEICGTVFQDCDADGNNEDPNTYDGVTITIIDQATGAQALDADGNAITDQVPSGGDFCFSDLPPGDYLFEYDNANPTIFWPTMDGGDSDMDQATEETTTAVNVTSGSGTTNDGADAGYFMLEFYCGVIWEDCNGDGINNDGQAYTSFAVNVIDNIAGGTAVLPDGSAITVDMVTNGYCVLLPPGEYVFEITSTDPDYFPTAMDQTSDDLDSDIDQTSFQTPPVTFETCMGQQQGGADVGFYRAGCIAGTYWHDFTGSINGDPIGYDTGDGDMGMPNGEVVITTMAGGPVTDIFGNAVPSVIVDGNGDYEFCDIPPGTYNVEFILQGGYQFWAQNGTLMDDNNNDAPGGNNGLVQNVLLNTCDNDMIEYVDAGVYQEVLIGGTIWIDQDLDGMLTSEISVTGISVNIFACGDCGGTPIGPTVVTDATGFAWVAPPGEYCIEIDPAMFDNGGPLATLFEVCDPMQDPNSNTQGDANGNDTGVMDGSGTSAIECIQITCPEDTPDPTVNLTFDFCFQTAACDDPMNIPPQLTIECTEIETDPDNLIICDLAILDAFCGTMFAQDTGNGPNPLCSEGGSPHNITWFGFVAGQGDFDIEMVPIGCTPGGGGQLGMQAGIYTDCSFTQEVWCASIPCSTDPINTADGSVDWVPGQTYYFFFDGCAGSICDFEINVVCNSQNCDPFAFDPPLGWELGGCTDEFMFPDDPLTGCVGGTYDVIVEGFEEFDLQFDWTVVTPMGSIEMINTDEGVLPYTFLEAGTYDVSFIVNNGCSDQQSSVEVEIVQLDDVDFGVIMICEGDQATPADVTVGGLTFVWDLGPITAPAYNDGGVNTYTEMGLAMSDCGCEYMQMVELQVLPNGDIETDQVVLCIDDYPYQYDGANITGGPFATTQTINGPGLSQSLAFDFTFQDDGMCDVLVNVDAITPMVSGNFVNQGCINGGNEFTFDPANISITGTVPFVATYVWTDQSGGILASGTTPSITVPETAGVSEVCLEIIVTVQGDFGDVDCSFDLLCIPTEFDGPDAPVIDGWPAPAQCVNGTIITYCFENYNDNLTYTITLPEGGTITNDLNSFGCFDVDWTGADLANAAIEIDVVDGCNLTNGDYLSIELTEAPNLSFDFEDGCSGQEIEFTYDGDFSEAGWIWDWDFGTGTITSSTSSNEEGPHTVVFPTGGAITVTLNVESAPGCSSTIMEMINISPPLPAPVVSCVDTGTDFVEFGWADNPDIDTYEYVVTNSAGVVVDMGTLAGSVTSLNVPATLGEELTITIFGEDANGCTSGTTIQPCTALDCNLPTATIDMGDAYCNTDAPIPFSVALDMALPAGMQNFSVDGVAIPDGDLFDPSAYAVGPHTIAFEFTEDGSGCPLFTSLPIEIFETPVLTGMAIVDPVCVSEDVGLTFSHVPDQATWDLGGGTLSSGGGVGPYLISYATPGPKTVIATSFNPLNPSCVSSPVTINFVVEPEIMAPNLSCGMTSQSSVEFTWTEDPNASYNVVDMSGLGTGVQTPGNYTVTGLLQGNMVTIQLEVTSNNSCPDIGPFDLTCTAEACPALVADIDQMEGMVICPSLDPFGFTATITADGMPVTGGTTTWAGTLPSLDMNTGSVDPSTIASGNYTVIVNYEDANNCTATDMINVTVIDPMAEIDASTLLMCETETLTLSATPVSGNAVQYNWDLGGGTGTPTNDGSGFDVTFNMEGSYNISLDIVVDGCQTNTDMVTVQVDPELEAPVIECQDVGMDFINFTWEPVAGATSYDVSIDGAAGVNQGGTGFMATGLSENETVMITVTAVTDSDCGDVSASFSCSSVPCPGITLTPSIMGTTETSFCTADTPSITLDAGVTGGDGTGVTTWMLPDGTTQTGSQLTLDLALLGSGNFTYNVDYAEGDCDGEGTIDVEVFVSPEISLMTMDPECYADNVGTILANVNANTSGFTLSLNGETPTTNTDFSGLPPNQYSIVVTDDNNCTATATTTITAAVEPSVNITGNSNIILGNDESFNLVTSATGITDIIWTDLDGTVLAQGADMNSLDLEQPQIDGTVCVEVLFADGNCSVMDCLDYTVREVKQIVFSNIFRPDAVNPENSMWKIYSNCEDMVLQEVGIYDRWGNLVFEARDVPFNGGETVVLWDGRFEGAQVVPGVYVYQIVADLGDGLIERYLGDITIIR